jgi:hypothetical protein
MRFVVYRVAVRFEVNINDFPGAIRRVSQASMT